MMANNYAIVNSGVVSNIAQANSPVADNWIPCDGTPAFIGGTYSAGTFSSPAASVAPTPLPDPALWWVDEGPFKDRLGADALAIAASTHDACKAVMAMLNNRKWVDLQGTSTANMLDLLIATLQPTANPLFAGSGPMTPAKKVVILATPVTPSERHKAVI